MITLARVLLAVALSLTVAGTAMAGDAGGAPKAALELGNTLSGTIERVDSQGRITVEGEIVRVTKDTQIMTPLRVPVAQIELRPGTEVEISVVEGAGGNEAAVIIANVVR